jgi:hypothetical protein
MELSSEEDSEDFAEKVWVLGCKYDLVLVLINGYERWVRLGSKLKVVYQLLCFVGLICKGHKILRCVIAQRLLQERSELYGAYFVWLEKVFATSGLVYGSLTHGIDVFDQAQFHSECDLNLICWIFWCQWQ